MSELVDVRVVQEAGDAPMAFLWRGRLYVVREVLGHWRERRDWWSTAAARALHGEESASSRPMSSEGPSFAVWSGESAGSSGELPGRVPGGVPGPAPDEGVAGPDRSRRSHRARAEHGEVHRRSHGRPSADRHSGEKREGAGGHDDTGQAEHHEFLLDSECEVWRVEASTGRAFGSGVYDLSRTPSRVQATDSWRLLQVAD